MERKRINTRKGTLKFAGILFTVQLFFSLLSCRQAPPQEQVTEGKGILNIYVFHPANKCDACSAIEENAKLVLDQHFRALVEDGSIQFRSINFDSRDNKVIVEKYRISYTSLLLVTRDGTVTDLTNFAMNHAFMNPEKFRAFLESEIESKLN